MNPIHTKKYSPQTTKKRLSGKKRVNLKKEKSNKNSSESNSKKVWSADALIESMKPSSEELQYRNEISKECYKLEKYSKFFRCTKCLLNLNSVIQKHKEVPIHPVLGVLMCQKCCNYYQDGEFSLDSEGEDKYCRWCGEGGTILGCAQCICGFCASCIKQHFKVGYFKKVQKDDKWLCFLCDPKPLWTLRYICSLAVQVSQGVVTVSADMSTSITNTNNINMEQSASSENLNNKNSSPAKKKNSRKRIYISSSDESENDTRKKLQKKIKLWKSPLNCSSKEKKVESLENIESNVLKEIRKVLKLSEYQFSFGVTWSNKMLKKLGSSDFLPTSKDLANECQKIKWFLSLSSTYLVQFCNSVNSIEKSLLSDDGTKISQDVLDENQLPYTTILQFLGFINSQIKTFMEKGINLSDILQPDYNDDSIIRIWNKLKSNSSPNSGSCNSIKSTTHFTSDDDKATENKEATEDEKADSEDKNKNESSLDILRNQIPDTNSSECDEEFSTNNIISEEMNYLKTSDPKGDIQEILAILENA